LSNDLDSAEITKINNILASKSITYRFWWKRDIWNGYYLQQAAQ
jgi:hypothetical protein